MGISESKWLSFIYAIRWEDTNNLGPSKGLAISAKTKLNDPWLLTKLTLGEWNTCATAITLHSKAFIYRAGLSCHHHDTVCYKRWLRMIKVWRMRKRKWPTTTQFHFRRTKQGFCSNSYRVFVCVCVSTVHLGKYTRVTVWTERNLCTIWLTRNPQCSRTVISLYGYRVDLWEDRLFYHRHHATVYQVWWINTLAMNMKESVHCSNLYLCTIYCLNTLRIFKYGRRN